MASTGAQHSYTIDREGVTTMPPNIPLELIDFILDFLLYDLSSLKSCALVTRSRLPSLRRRLFHTKSIDPHTDYDGLMAVLQTSPGVADSVRCLKLLAPDYASRSGTIAAQDAVGMANLCVMFSNVKSLQLSNFNFQRMNDEVLRKFLASLVHIACSATKLLLDRISFALADECLQFIHAFPHVTDLALVKTCVTG